ncbi:hypothetical protein RCL1_002491 [Eukaryota sp. TZLM3-RCL]
MDFYVNLLAGASTGLLGDICLSPLDTIRTTYTSPRHSLGRSASQITRDIYKANGIGGFYTGLGPVAVLSPLASAIFYSTRGHLNGTLKQWFSDKGHELKKSDVPALKMIGAHMSKNSTSLASSGSAMIAEVFGSLLWNPMAVLKSRQQIAASKGLPVPSSFQLTRELGLAGIFRGFAASQLMFVPYNGMYWAVYDKMFNSLSKLIGKEGTPRNKMPAWTIMSSSLAAGLATSVVTYPIGTIMVNQQTADHPKSMVSTAMDLYNSHGMGIFYHGFGMKFVGSIPRSLLTMWSYEKFRTFYAGLLSKKTWTKTVPEVAEKVQKKAEKRAKKK